MHEIQISIYPHGVARKLGQDVVVQRLNLLNKFDDCAIEELQDGDQYFVPMQELPQRSGEDILNYIEENQIDIVHVPTGAIADEAPKFEIELYSHGTELAETLWTDSVRDAINYLMDMSEEEI
jgi:hypothetical protein|tara:strand:+ start:1232 stop:1600 length:369 start_codon:yes stop_codon:yes gene_type:complete